MSEIGDAEPGAKLEDDCDGEAPGEVEQDTDLLESDVNKLTNKSLKDDLTLIVEDKQLYVNRAILAYASPVFDIMFYGKFEEKNVNEMPLPRKNFKDVVEFLRCITPGMMRSITMKNVFNVLPLAHEYEVVCLESACEVCFEQYLAENRESDEVYEIMKIAIVYGLDEIEEKCIDIIAERPLEEFEETGSRFKLPENALNMIRTKILRNIKTKYKDVFGHVRTSRALYQFLGEEAKQSDLVKRYMEGRVVGECATLKVGSSFKASTDMLIDGQQLHIDVSVTGYSDVTRVTINSDKASINCLVAVYVMNWMNGKEDKKHVETIKLGRKPYLLSIQLWNTNLLSKEEAGFIRNGTIEFRIYLFWLK